MAMNIWGANHGIAHHWTNATGAGIASGDIVVLGGGLTATLAVATGDIADGEEGVVLTNVGVTAPAASAGTWAQGEALTWDSSAGEFIAYAATPDEDDVSGSVAAAALKEALDTDARVWLTGVPGMLGQA
jgi:predicted RecA/RadA family phage recombinase